MTEHSKVTKGPKMSSSAETTPTDYSYSRLRGRTCNNMKTPVELWEAGSTLRPGLWRQTKLPCHDDRKHASLAVSTWTIRTNQSGNPEKRSRNQVTGRNQVCHVHVQVEMCSHCLLTARRLSSPQKRALMLHIKENTISYITCNFILIKELLFN